ncbi:hypothetical protein [Brachymonas chironomi]|uniref:hypothetical protein n=1 Tax=Brachymonas chironomi TaxID=491919 RepID=UPI000381249B|nr:hypothetical protein [Brachymonas chironomi]
MTRLLRLLPLLPFCLLLQGCGVTAVAGAAVGAAISVTGAVVSTGVKLTGKAIGAGIDAVSGSDAAAEGVAVGQQAAPVPATEPVATPAPAY